MTKSVASLVEQARKSTNALRDAARQGGMDHRVRDPHVLAIHAVIDALEREAASRLSSPAATPAPANGELMNRSLRHELLRQEADRQGKSLCMVRSPVGEWQLGYGEAAADLDWLGHGSTPDKAIQNALETDTVLKALAEDIPWDKT